MKTQSKKIKYQNETNCHPVSSLYPVLRDSSGYRHEYVVGAQLLKLTWLISNLLWTCIGVNKEEEE